MIMCICNAVHEHLHCMKFPRCGWPFLICPVPTPQGVRGSVDEHGVSGTPQRVLAVGRARRQGMLNGNVAGAAASVAISVYNHSTGAAGRTVVAAAFVAAQPPASPRGSQPGPGASAQEDLFVMTADGLLTRHSLKPLQTAPEYPLNGR